MSNSDYCPCNVVKRGTCYDRVCPSVCLSHLISTPKWFGIHDMKICFPSYDREMFLYFEDKFRNPKFRVSTRTSALNRAPCRHRKFDQ